MTLDLKRREDELKHATHLVLDNVIAQTSFAFAFVSETNSDIPAEGKKVSLSTS